MWSPPVLKPSAGFLLSNTSASTSRLCRIWDCGCCTSLCCRWPLTQPMSRGSAWCVTMVHHGTLCTVAPQRAQVLIMLHSADRVASKPLTASIFLSVNLYLWNSLLQLPALLEDVFAHTRKEEGFFKSIFHRLHQDIEYFYLDCMSQEREFSLVNYTLLFTAPVLKWVNAVSAMHYYFQDSEQKLYKRWSIM